MAWTSRCPKCEKSGFELAENSPSGSRYKFHFIQCSSCGCVVGVVDWYNIGVIVKDIQEKVEKIDSHIGVLGESLADWSGRVGAVIRSISDTVDRVASKVGVK